MNRQTYKNSEEYMHSCMDDSAHDREHVYRVLYAALDIAGRRAAAAEFYQALLGEARDMVENGAELLRQCIAEDKPTIGMDHLELQEKT